MVQISIQKFNGFHFLWRGGNNFLFSRETGAVPLGNEKLLPTFQFLWIIPQEGSINNEISQNLFMFHLLGVLQTLHVEARQKVEGVRWDLPVLASCLLSCCRTSHQPESVKLCLQSVPKLSVILLKHFPALFDLHNRSEASWLKTEQAVFCGIFCPSLTCSWSVGLRGAGRQRPADL